VFSSGLVRTDWIGYEQGREVSRRRQVFVEGSKTQLAHEEVAVATTKRPWEPIARGDLGQRVWQVVEAIEEEGFLGSDLLREGDRPSALEMASLARGAAGRALFCLYLKLSRASPKGGDPTLQLLRRAADELAKAVPRPGLFTGVAGVSWAAHHVRMLHSEGFLEDPSVDIDETLGELLELDTWRAGYDLVGGLVGIGVYSLERLPRQFAWKSLERIVMHLAHLAKHTPEGVVWTMEPNLIPKDRREQFPDGYFDLGVAHGIAGVIALLGQVYAVGVCRSEVEALLSGAVSWLLSHRLPKGSPVCFPAMVDCRNSRPVPARTAWCYGDPGIAAALLVAARGAGEPAWEREARLIGRLAALRPILDTGIVDASVCHGAAGVAHIFNRLYQESGDPVFKSAALEWIERTLAMRRPGKGIAGYQYLFFHPGGYSVWTNRVGLLEGVAGIGLALLATASLVEPSWDRPFLLSPCLRCSTALDQRTNTSGLENAFQQDGEARPESLGLC
jgi:lantibiotic modifying enzyme